MTILVTFSCSGGTNKCDRVVTVSNGGMVVSLEGDRIGSRLQNPFLQVMGMVAKRYFEREATSIAALGRHELTRRIRNFTGRFKLDFTEDYLNRLSVDRLRHILLAAVMNAGRHN